MDTKNGLSLAYATAIIMPNRVVADGNLPTNSAGSFDGCISNHRNEYHIQPQ